MEYTIGIDLGTTNCALAYARLEPDGPTEVLPIDQWQDVGTIVSRNVLPSFLYRPQESEKAGFAASPEGGRDWIVGEAAKARAIGAPGRVVHSAKSWLANHASDPTAALLPWKSADLGEHERISPLAASAAFLAHLRGAWDRAFPASPMREQSVTITVPASFDVAAQRATLDAAQMAGLSGAVRLLEEPQAAFYRGLEEGSVEVNALQPGEHVLVVDVGGGTSDFSLFRVGAADETGGPPSLERVAVSEHILLGGDNVDLALAHMIEGQLLPDGSSLEGESWHHLLARARALKERALGVPDEEVLRVSVPGRGSGLLAGTLSTEVDAATIREVVLEGFFPACDRQSRPQEGRSALQEWGLPYAADFAVTRYLADFVREHPPVDAILFNGGTLAPTMVRDRLIGLLEEWQAGVRPRLLPNAELDLAVARGAAYFGRVLAGLGRRIAAGAARGVFLEIGAGEAGRQLLCALPRGAPPEAIFRAEVEGLRVHLNRRVQFRAWQGAHRMNQAAGEIVPWAEGDFTELPPLETTLHHLEAEDETIPVSLASHLNELGLLQVELVGHSPFSVHGMFLAFNLRRTGATAEKEELTSPKLEVETEVSIPREAIEDAEKYLCHWIGRNRLAKGETLSPTRMLAHLERRVGFGRQDWTIEMVRRLADGVLEHAIVRNRSPEHLETFLYLVGWCLRPGFGDGRDVVRLNQLWEIAGPDALPSAKRTEAAFSLLWRRVSGGLSTERQAALFASRGERWCAPQKAPAEGVLLAGSLELLPVADRAQLVEVFLERAETQAREDEHPAPYLAALTDLLTRTPLRGADAVVLPPELVEAAWDRLRKLDWAQPGMMKVVPLFLRAARRMEDSTLNIPAKTSRRIADHLAKLDVAPQTLLPLREVIPLTAKEKAAFYEEGLPPGLVLEPA